MKRKKKLEKIKKKNKEKKPTSKAALKDNLKELPYMAEIKNVFNTNQQHTGAGWNKIVSVLKNNNYKGDSAWFKKVRKSVKLGYSKFINRITTTPVPKVTEIKTKSPAVKPTPIARSPARYTPAQYVYVYRPQWRWVMRWNSYLTYYWASWYQWYWYMSCWGWWWWRWCRWFAGWRWYSYPVWYWRSYNYWTLAYY